MFDQHAPEPDRAHASRRAWDAVGQGGFWKTLSAIASPSALVATQLTAGGLSRQHISSPRCAPTWVPRWATVVHPTISYVLNFRIAPGCSSSKLLVLLTYTIVVSSAPIPFINPVCMGFVAMSQIPTVVALGGKMNLAELSEGGWLSEGADFLRSS